MAPTRTPLASLLFFTSGATALAYQVIWFKRFSHFWGNSSLAMAGVVAGFLLGLGIGARLLSGLADRARSPLYVYGLFEVAIAGLSLAVPLQLGLLLEWTSSLQVALEGRTLPLAVLPAWYRDQVADLADMAQRLDLGLRRTLEAGGMEETDAALESLSHDVLRLGQFTRTLGYLAAPPGANGATLDLSGLAADFLSTLASEDEAGPRFLFRGEPETRVRADKGLLVLVLDALLTVTSLVAGQGGEVRVAVERGEDQAHLTIQFPAGVLTDLEPARWMEPYALHRRLPGVGPNAVAAAASILAGQGGGLELVADGSQRTFQLHLPLA